VISSRVTYPLKQLEVGLDMSYTVVASNFEGFTLGQNVTDKDLESHDIAWLLRLGMIQANDTTKSIKKDEAK
jgi:hypothetical protein